MDGRTPGAAPADTAANRQAAQERRLVRLLTALAFCGGLGVVLLFAGSRALFLSYFGQGELPLLYMGGAAGAMAAGYVASRLEPVLPRRLFFPGLLALSGILLLGVRVWLALGGEEWPVLVAALWFEGCFVLVSLGVWGLAGELLDLQQAKRLFGAIGAGEYAAAAAGGVAGVALASVSSAADVFTVAGVSHVAGAFIAAMAVRANSQTNRSSRPASKKPEPFSSSRAFRDRYAVLLHVLWGVGIAALVLADAALNVQAARYFGDSASLTRFFSVMCLVLALSVMGVRALASGRLLQRFGPANVQLFLPLALAPAALAVVAAGVAEAGTVVLFWLAAVLRYVDYTVRYGAHRPAFLALYQPVPSHLRLRVQASVEGLADPLFTVLAGLSLLLIQNMFSLGAPAMAGVLLFVLAVWTSLSLLLRKRYAAAVDEVLSRRGLGAADMEFLDERAQNILARRLESDDPNEVILSADIFETRLPESMETVVMTNLYHSSEDVVLDALERTERLALPMAAEMALDLAQFSDSSRVQAAALKAYAAAFHADALEVLLQRQDAEEPLVRRAAAASLVRYGGIEGVLAGGRYILDMAGSEKARERKEAAVLLQAVANPAFYRPLLPLLADPDRSVRRAALQAAASLGASRLAGPCLEAGNAQGLAGRAASALAAVCREQPEKLLELCNAPERTTQERRCLAMAAGRLDGAAAVETLARLVLDKHPTVRREALHGLRGREAEAKYSREEVRALLTAEAMETCWQLGAAARLQDMAPQTSALLHEEAEQSIRRSLGVLCLLRPAAARGLEGLARHNRSERAFALEAVEARLDRELLALALALAEPMEPEERLRALEQTVCRRDAPSSAKTVIQNVILPRDYFVCELTSSMALYELAKADAALAAELVCNVLESSNSLGEVRETAASLTAVWNAGNG